MAVRVLDLHYPVVAGRPNSDGGLSLTKAYVYGTAFPILPGLFVTAGHVAQDAEGDGTPALGWMGPEGEIKAFAIAESEQFKGLDLALCYVPDLVKVVPFTIEFDQGLEMLDPAYAIGFPHAVDPEWVSMAPRALRGFVVTRREMYQLPAQPPGYELSFGAPQGLSGAPLVSHVRGSHRCYGYVVQQGVLGLGDQQTVVGVAIDITVLLSIETQLMGIGALANALGQKPKQLEPPSPRQLPGGAKPLDEGAAHWPDDFVDPGATDHD
jgi:hypothetical protein